MKSSGEQQNKMYYNPLYLNVLMKLNVKILQQGLTHCPQLKGERNGLALKWNRFLFWLTESYRMLVVNQLKHILKP